MRPVERTTINDRSLQPERAVSVSRPTPHIDVHPPIQSITGPRIYPSKDSSTNSETLPVDLDMWEVVCRRDRTDAVAALGRWIPMGNPDSKSCALARLECSCVMFWFDKRIVVAGGGKGKWKAQVGVGHRIESRLRLDRFDGSEEGACEG
jgi:hypothetical protein